MPDRILKPDSGNDLVLQNDDGSGKIEINENASIPVTGTLDVSGATLTTSSGQKQAIVQAGPGSGTLDVSSGTFTTSSAQKQAIVQAGPGSGTLDVSSGTLTTSTAQKQAIVDGATIEAQDLASGSGTSLPNNVQDAITRLGSVTSGTFNGAIGGSATFPSGSILNANSNQTSSYIVITTAYNDSPTNYVTVLNSDTFTVKSASSNILVFASLNIEFKGGTSCYVRITESTTGLSQILNDYLAYNSATSSTPCFQYEHTHGQSAGTSLTYSMQLALRTANVNGVRLNDHFTAGQNQSRITTFEVQA